MPGNIAVDSKVAFFPRDVKSHTFSNEKKNISTFTPIAKIIAFPLPSF